MNLTDANPLEIRFTHEAGMQSSSSRVIFTLSGSDGINHNETGVSLTEWELYQPSYSIQNNPYLADENGFVALGRVYSNKYQKPVFPVSFKNLSSYDFGSIMVAFDFMAIINDVHSIHDLKLMFRVNSGDWQQAEGGVLKMDRFEADDREIGTVSMQLNLNQIFLGKEDVIHFKWIADRHPSESDYPVFLQRIELFPEISNIEKLNRGSLIITEIMPVSRVDGVDFEYIELYNPGNYDVQLKGIEIKTSSGSHVIQQDILVPPYSFAVLSNVDISGINGIRNSYKYQNSLLPAKGGRIEMIQHQEAIAAATYEQSEHGTALQLMEMIHAYDGYTSLAFLKPAEDSFFPNLAGSPGAAGSSIPIYRRALVNEGWYLLAPPGKLNARLSRHPSIQYYTLNGEQISPDLIEPFTPFFVHKSNQEAVTVYSEGLNVGGVPRSPFVEHILPDGNRLISAAAPTGKSIVEIMREHGIQVPPLILAWNERTQSFRLRNTELETLLDWTPFILPGSFEINTGTSMSAVAADDRLARRITFSLFDGDGTNRRFVDQSIIGFLPQPAEGESVRYDLPSLMPAYRSQGNRMTELPFMYLSSQESQERINSFLHLPYDIRNDYTVGLGFQFTSDQTRGQAVLEWQIPDDIPDEWIIDLKDNHAGLTINMREENSYRFRYTINQKQAEQNDRAVSLESPMVTETNRFSVELKPFESVEEIAEETRPGSIELRQNYPNPFNPATNITFYLPEDRMVRVGIYNIVGQQVALLVDENLQAGEHSVIWDAANNPSGIYIVQLETGNRILTRKITLIK